MKIKPLEFINALRATDEYIKDIYSSGGCYQFHLLLKKLFPNAIPYINYQKDHIITRIGGYFYDINGIADYTNFEPLKKEDITMVEKWSFRKNYLLKVSECPACEEPICFQTS